METCFFSQKGLLPPLRAVKSRDTLKGTEQGSAFPPRSLHSPHSKPHSPMTHSHDQAHPPLADVELSLRGVTCFEDLQPGPHPMWVLSDRLQFCPIAQGGCCPSRRPADPGGSRGARSVGRSGPSRGTQEGTGGFGGLEVPPLADVPAQAQAPRRTPARACARTRGPLRGAAPRAPATTPTPK